ncbi:GNAT family N-acetyltransferase [Pedobacter nyackensis]|uniref:GNAT family N-acetyltransferase n=1 Tax=Pedobacter nyackensis TaxID=475255 RepID=UPI0029306EDE|nr:GNAT family N-acetyltransferase [Pedobacter nyackensis]
MNVNIRVAVKEDCERLLELVNELAVFERAPEEVTVTLEEFVDAGFGPNKVWDAIVAEENGFIAGFAIYYTRYSTWKGRRLYLEDFIVTESYRGRGIGKLLFEAVLKDAKDKNFNGMNWQVLDWNEPAINFYKKYGADLDPEWLNGSFTKEQIMK